MTKRVSGTKRLSLRKETVKDLDARPGEAKELGKDQLDGVNGGIGLSGAACAGGGRGRGPCPTRSRGTGQVFTVECPTLRCNPVK